MNRFFGSGTASTGFITVIALASFITGGCASGAGGDTDATVDSVVADAISDSIHDALSDVINDSSDPTELPVNINLVTWKIASSAVVNGDGPVLSAVGFDDSTWLTAEVPGTVAGAQTDAGVLDNPLYGENLKNTPGWTYSFLPMPEDSPYKPSWWYRTEFDTPMAGADGRTWLVFEGINYSANVWVNGVQIATRDDVVGTFREFRFDVTDHVTAGSKCAVAVEVFVPDIFNDLAIYWVDWNPEPPDYNMGLWMPARVETRGAVSIMNPAVQTKLQDDGSAELTLLVELSNALDAPVDVLITGRINDDTPFDYPVTLGAGELTEIRITSTDVPALHVKEPILWWPYSYGEPNLHTMKITATVNDVQSDATQFSFGIREVTAEMQPPNQIRYLINRKPILIRGGGWAPDIFLRDDPDRDRAEIAYVKDMGLNTIRLEGKFENHFFYDLADREGILLMPGWCCCDTWETWDIWDLTDHSVARSSLENQLRRLRRHASVFTWLNGSDFHPVPEVEQMYLTVADMASWDLPIVSNATENASEVTGPSGMKMTGPYNWVPPNYWYLAVPADATADPAIQTGTDEWPWMYGGAFGFNSESGPGPSIPPLDSLIRMMPEADLWPIKEPFLFHSGGTSTATDRLGIFRDAMDARLGVPTGLADFAMKSQVMTYEAHRAMFEAQGRNKYFATGHIQWMLNNAWPGMIWQLYDYFLRPGGSYFGAKKAMRPLHVQYSYDDQSVWVVNSTLAEHRQMNVNASLYSIDSALVMQSDTALAALPPDGNIEVVSLVTDIAANIEALSPMYFLDLKLTDREGNVLDRNFYWLPVTPDTFEMVENEDNRPVVDFADMTALSDLPSVTLNVAAPETVASDTKTMITQKITNNSEYIAFFVELLLFDTITGEPILPVIWDDNYVSLLPGESMTLTATVNHDDVDMKNPHVKVTGWNLTP
jgi:exo-1,4-beta-D-glucosaminidase